MMLKRNYFFYPLLLSLLVHFSVFAQTAKIPIKILDVGQLKAVKAREKKGRFDAIGEIIETHDDVLQEAIISEKGGFVLFQLAYHASDVKGINFYFEKVALPNGSTFFLKGNYRGQTLQLPLNSKNNLDKLATGFIYGDYAELHISVPADQLDQAVVLLEGIGLTNKRILPTDARKDFGDAASCNINIGCEEGTLWQEVGQSVVRILVRNENLVGWCTGVLVNNTAEDFTPYILTAQHCGLNEFTGNLVAKSNFDQWVFYFNYEVNGCVGSFLEFDLPRNIMAGADLIAHSDDQGGDFGSDFLLLKLQNDIPSSFNPVFAGWSSQELNAAAGVAIHHPQGDVKKISTYNTSVESSQFSSEGSVRNTHWKVFWAETDNGFGITEAGSSGAPLFNNAGQIIGNLTGGLASCTRPDGFDLFGKLSYHWFSNGEDLEQQLAPWLDPLGLDVFAWRSIDYSGKLVTDTDDEITSSTFEIYPNPSQGKFSVIVPTKLYNTSLTLNIYDKLGRTVHRESIDADERINLTHLQKGLYFLTISNAENVYRQKIVIE